MTVPGGRRDRLVLLAAFAVAAFLLFFRLAGHDPLTDEEELAFRALGYVDYLNAPYQTTPYEWFAPPPWWVGLSFHDHPPLLFLVEHVVLRLLGDSLLAVRLPFALLGLASLGLLVALARALYGRPAAAIVAGLGAVNTCWLWVFRLGLQEGMVLFFLLAGIYCLTRAPADARWLLAWGLALGLGMLTKYTSILLVPVSLAYVALLAPSLLRRRELVLGLLAAGAVFSPVVVYNAALLHAVGHFDLQLATVLGQSTPEWSVLPGKAIGTFAERLGGFVPSLWWNATWLFVLLLAVSLLAMLARAAGRRPPDRRTMADAFVVSALGLAGLLVLLVGPSARFLTLLMPFALLACASGLSLPLEVGTTRLARVGGAILLAGAIGGQALISFETLHAAGRRETPSWIVGALRTESAAWGYGDLERYLTELLDTARPAVTFGLPPRLGFVEAMRARNPRRTGGARRPWLVVYDPRINNVAKLWLYDRRYFYDGWPILSVDDYMALRRAHPSGFEALGITDYYYVAAEPGLFTAGNASTSEHAAAMAERLRSVAPERALVGPDGQRTFTVYRTREPL